MIVKLAGIDESLKAKYEATYDRIKAKLGSLRTELTLANNTAADELKASAARKAKWTSCMEADVKANIEFQAKFADVEQRRMENVNNCALCTSEA